MSRLPASDEARGVGCLRRLPGCLLAAAGGMGLLALVLLGLLLAAQSRWTRQSVTGVWPYPPVPTFVLEPDPGMVIGSRSASVHALTIGGDADTMLFWVYARQAPADTARYALSLAEPIAKAARLSLGLSPGGSGLAENALFCEVSAFRYPDLDLYERLGIESDPGGTDFYWPSAPAGVGKNVLEARVSPSGDAVAVLVTSTPPEEVNVLFGVNVVYPDPFVHHVFRLSDLAPLAPRRVVDLGGQRPMTMCWAPDGRHVLYTDYGPFDFALAPGGSAGGPEW